MRGVDETLRLEVEQRCREWQEVINVGDDMYRSFLWIHFAVGRCTLGTILNTIVSKYT